jgi:hypothetical protein
MRAAIALPAAILAVLSGSALAGSVAQGFHVRVDLNASTGVRLEAPATAAIVPAADPHSVTVPSALVIRTSRTHALRIRLEVVDPAVKSIEVLGLGKPVHVERGPTSVLVPPEGKDGTRTLSYVVSYGKDGRSRRGVPLLATVIP